MVLAVAALLLMCELTPGQESPGLLKTGDAAPAFTLPLVLQAPDGTTATLDSRRGK